MTFSAITNSNYDTPILFLTFNRPLETKLVFEAIKLIKPKKLFIACDGPRLNHKTDNLNVQKVRAIVKGVSWKCDVEYLFSNVNLGCGPGVSGAINWFFSRVDHGIILEDDCLPNATFFLFCREMLYKYKDDNEVMAITGTNIAKGIRYESDYVFSSFPIMWGWASWRRAWKRYDYQIKKWPAVKKEKSLSKSSMDTWKLHPVYNELFEKTYQAGLDSTLNTWDHQWIFCNWLNFGLTVTPTKNLVQNIGFGSNATHTLKDNLRRGHLTTFTSFPPYLGPLSKVPHVATDLYISKHWFTATWVYYAKIILLRFKFVSFSWAYFKNFFKL